MAELEDIPPTVYPDGSVIGNFDAGTNPPEDPEILHRPHAFALMHGDDGAKVAYGQLLWRIDQINLFYALDGSDGSLLDEGTASGVANPAHGHARSGQNAVGGLNAKVPTIDTEDGTAFSSSLETKYHQLNGYGDVYLYWKVDLDHADRVTKCWVTVDGTTAQNDVDAVPIGFTLVDRLTATSSTDHEGTYRVKLGSVNEDAQVTQDISSDVHWSICLLGRVNETGS
tara:strand:+ start:2086 stop:2766 length:681 start_codon:yes stop_codon:yes gene_type:complete